MASEKQQSGFMKLVSNVKFWLVTAGFFISTITFFYGYTHDWFEGIKKKGVEEQQELLRKKKLDNIIMLYDMNINNVRLPEELRQTDSVIFSIVNQDKHRIDSLRFMVTQLNALIFSRAYVPTVKITDEHNCTYWLKKDFNGQFWEVTEETSPRGQKSLTLQYTIRWNAVNSSYEYTDYNGVVRTLPHKWER